MPTFEITSPDGRTFQVTAPEGATQDEVLKYAQSNMPVAKQAGSALNDIPRQVGLATRYGIEGLATGAQLVTEPLRYITDKLTPDRTGTLSGLITGEKTPPKSTPLGVQATKFADFIGLPSPKNADERVVGDATRLLAGSGGLAGGAKYLAGKLPGMAGQAADFLAANPLQQMTSATGAGLAGGASREAGGNELQQGASALIGGVVGGKATDIASGASNLAKSLLNKNMTNQALDVKISNVLRQSGVDYSQVPERVRQSLRQELASALQADKELDPAAVSRLLDFRSAGVTPTRGMVSQNPVQITKEMNLAKMGANSSDEGLQGLALMQNQNNAKLISNMNALGADRGNTLAAGERVTSSVLGTQASLRGAEQAAWDAAKGQPGYRQPIAAGVLSDINSALDEEGMMGFLSPEISRYMAAFQSGQRQFTPQDYKNLMSMLATEKSVGGNPAAAARIASDTLLRAELKPAGFANTGNLPVTQGMAAGMRNADNSAADAIGAVNQARNATRQAYAYEDSNPLIRSVLSDGASSDPQRIAQRFVIGGTANEAADLMQQLGPNGIAPIKDAILTHLKSKALSGAADETGKFSQSAFNRALQSIGDRKLSMLFTPEELTALRTNARVASLMQSQPVGSAVNNSNSGALLLGRGLDFMRNIPIVGPNVAPALDNIRITLGTKAAKNVLPGLLAQQEKQPIGQSLLLPGAAFGGLLAAP